MIDHVSRAKLAWPLLAKKANSGDAPYTYKELCDILGLHHRAAGFFLGVIQEFCKKHNKPPLQALVVNKRTKLPGSGYYGSQRTKTAHEKALIAVRANMWEVKAPNLNA